MNTTFNINTTELDSKFLDSLKVLFPNKNIQLIVSEVDDDTEYLLSTQENKDRLLKSVNNIKNGCNLNEIDLDNLKLLAYEQSNI